MRIGKFAARTGMTRDTVRFYERRGLLVSSKPKGLSSSNSYRDYPETMVRRARLIGCGKGLGFTLKEIGQFIVAWEGGTLGADERRRVLTDKLRALDKRLKELKALRAEVVVALKSVDGGC